MALKYVGRSRFANMFVSSIIKSDEDEKKLELIGCQYLSAPLSLHLPRKVRNKRLMVRWMSSTYVHVVAHPSPKLICEHT